MSSNIAPAATTFEFWIDRGGTFTDLVARIGDGTLISAKYLSEAPERYRDAALFGMQDIVGRFGFATLADAPVRAVRMGTTVATNALLERHGDATLLVITQGFRDALLIGEQNRPDIFALHIQRPAPLFADVVEVHERVAADGTILVPLDEKLLRRDLQHAYDAGLRSAAIVLLHGYRFTHNETRCAQIAREIGFDHVCVSHETGGLAKLVARGDTTVVDAYLTPVLRRYIDQLQSGVGPRIAPQLRFMQSSGGLTDSAGFRGFNSVLSGPAGGVVGVARTAASAGFERIIGFDMGGTSTDITLYDRDFERSVDNRVAGVRLQTPMLTVHTIAAGGGSQLRFADGRLQVGPESAGAAPGPVCYRRGGPLAVTDIQVLLGRLQSDCFPAVFGPDGDQALDREATVQAFGQLADEIGNGQSIEALAEDFFRVAIDKMALAIRSACLSRGIDVNAFTLGSFGGAAGQHACAVAASLGLSSILISPFAGVLSALGMGMADQSAIRLRSVRQPLTDALVIDLQASFDTLVNAAQTALSSDADVTVLRRCQLRYRGSDTALEVMFGDPQVMRRAFEEAHHRRFGLRDAKQEVIVESISVEAILAGAPPAPPTATAISRDGEPVALRKVWFDGQWHDTPIYQRATLRAGQQIESPALIVDDHGTTVVEPLWSARVLQDAHLLLESTSKKTVAPSRASSPECEPARLELFNNLFTHIAEQMGAVLQKTARSVNIKERLDFSCALFDDAGQLLANAPHMPVHLGSMGESVGAVLRAFPDMRDGDSFVLNDPYAGGTHLPDITVVTPFFGQRDGAPMFYLAARGHHADVGGVSPGSMPARSTHIEQEGVLLSPRRLVHGNRFDDQGIRRALSEARYPARDPDQNVADLMAQLAANRFGGRLLEEMIAEHGASVATRYARHVQDNAAAAVAEVIATLKGGHHVLIMDEGQRIEVTITIDKGRARVDFTGTSAQLPGNFNAPSAVCRAAVLFVFRCLVRRPIPMNAGCMEAVDLVIPKGSFLAPSSPAAVAAGNVETSMCITDALFAALGVLSSSQGTMNNVTFGNDRVQYYETLCGGAGAGEGFDGCSAIHTHMTNSRLTDPEIIEARFPVRIRHFGLRPQSGGAGRWRGGDGLIREYEFLEPLQVSLLGNRRRTAPFGLRGGGDAAPGINTLIRANGRSEVLPATAEVHVLPGDRLRIETPGGGGFGPAGRGQT